MKFEGYSILHYEHDAPIRKMPGYQIGMPRHFRESLHSFLKPSLFCYSSLLFCIMTSSLSSSYDLVLRLHEARKFTQAVILKAFSHSEEENESYPEIMEDLGPS